MAKPTKIKPHKGGRTERLQVRLDPDTKERLEAIATQTNCTMADVITALLKQDTDALIAYVDKLTDYGRNDPTE